jgi:hypothetical protein
MVAALIHADGQTDMTKAVGASCYYANAPKNFTTVSFNKYCVRLAHLDAHAGVISSALFSNVPCLGLRYLSL